MKNGSSPRSWRSVDRRLLQMVTQWTRRLESQGAQLAIPWLACVDEANAAGSR